ncbi:MAG TPA: hydroxymethylbilane synthase [Gammaproteobacteria bacterium]|jgi:hydroxymethylbilane synthase|nr:hydroxymethylbilane synthase [Gammaproteobacteria bacterium]
MRKRHLIIATRESPLALHQAEFIRTRLMAAHPDLSVSLLGITTEGDQRLAVTLREIGGKGLFVKELEEALLAGKADIAVHSMKDMPMVLPPGLRLSAIVKREEPRDVFVSNQYQTFNALPPGAIVGTSSLRRQTQLRALRPDIVLENLRGNVNTRLSRLDRGDFSALILAGAGLLRMQLAARIRYYFSVEECLPAAGQGALGIECRAEDPAVHALVAFLNDRTTQLCVSAERAMCKELGGGCQVPVAAYAEQVGELITLRGLVANRAGTQFLRATSSGDAALAVALGIEVAGMLLAQGAADVLKEFV